MVPESLTTRRPSQTNARLSLKTLFAVLYLFGGVSAVTVLISKLVAQPLYQQLVECRREYAQLATKLCATLYESLVETRAAMSRKYLAKSVRFEQESDANDPDTTPEAPASAYPDLRQLIDNLGSLAPTRYTELQPLRQSTEALETLSQSLTYSGLGDHFSPTIAVAEPTEPRPNTVHEFKTEIRSIKGSLLSMR